MISVTQVVLLLSVIGAVGLLTVYGAVVIFSHTPRRVVASELKYKTTGDEEGELPPTANAGIKRDHEGIVLSVVIPCYNERKRLGTMLDESLPFLQRKFRNQYEVLIVDDGSNDGTGDYALQKAVEHGLAPHVMRVVTLAHNRGKGGAVAHGLLHVRGEYGLFVDADGATQFSDLDGWTDQLGTTAPGVVVGSRAHMVNTDAVVKRTFIRNLLMRGLHVLVYIFGVRSVRDTQCGFKLFNYDAIRLIFPNLHNERWIFDVEVLLLAEMQGIPITENAVCWKEIDGSKVNLAKDSIDMAVDLVITRLAYLFGIYKVEGKKDV
ncbi:glycosyltransferase family 2 protein [Suhomyces tanzawaensis NRRL Y-17324]|uniref:dolichyl-phosphate beta-glucosyltransferase n=1 Tax=Suhomyces tanzawaensis NRRL Y-17324 TaxID=984487 RepID=A0A1E4SRN9_9ASCO|nr:glycosyltransferase family 2 protein [Suhomyces tanzawaensis NRRL Y-17324]ODV82168.1 glycosyltransferase family 2 protein [Suhomyces tanzawaensis NRRL Y-17324]